MRDFRCWQVLLLFFDQNKPATKACESIKKMYPDIALSYESCKRSMYRRFQDEKFQKIIDKYLHIKQTENLLRYSKLLINVFDIHEKFFDKEVSDEEIRKNRSTTQIRCNLAFYSYHDAISRSTFWIKL